MPIVADNSGNIFEGLFAISNRALKIIVVDDHDHSLSSSNRALPRRCDVIAVQLSQLFNSGHSFEYLTFPKDPIFGNLTRRLLLPFANRSSQVALPRMQVLLRPKAYNRAPVTTQNSAGLRR